MKLKDLAEKYGEQEVLCWAERADESLEWVNIKLEPPKPKTVWDLVYGDKYVRITGTGGVSECEVCTKITYDRQRDVGNVFLTKEEAEREVERRKVEALLLKRGGRRWFKNREYNYFLRDDDHLGNGFWIDEIKDSPVQGAIYFDTYEDVEKAIKEIGAERIIKALFEVR